MAIQPVVKMCCCNCTLPVRFDLKMLNFPEDDRDDQSWTYYFDFQGTPFIWVFALTPHFTEEAWVNEIGRLETENGIDLGKFKFKKVSCPKDYVVGSQNEMYKNPVPGTKSGTEERNMMVPKSEVETENGNL